MSDKQPDIKIELKNVRLSFPHLFEPHAIEEGKEPKYQATFLLDNKEHAATIKQIEELTERTALDLFKKKVPLKHRPLRDGNEKPDIDGYGDGIHFVSASRKTRPAVVDRKLNPLTADDNVLYAGCYVNATIRLFAYEHKTGGRGVSAELRGVQFVKDGESFGVAPVKAEDEFEAIDDADVDGY